MWPSRSTENATIEWHPYAQWLKCNGEEQAIYDLIMDTWDEPDQMPLAMPIMWIQVGHGIFMLADNHWNVTVNGKRLQSWTTKYPIQTRTWLYEEEE